MRNFLQDGNMIRVAAPYAVATGDGCQVGAMFGLAGNTAAIGEILDLITIGEMRFTALSTDTGAVGTAMYWDNTNRRLTTTADAWVSVGVLTQAKTSGQTTAVIRLGMGHQASNSLLVKRDPVTGNVDLIGSTGKTIAGLSTLKDKIRLGLQAQLTKPWQSSFWNLPSAWTASQAVYGGECRSSGGNWYIALASGTCGTNAPANVNPAIGTTYFSAWFDGAADGSAGGVGWVYFGKAPSVYAGDASTTVAVAFSASTDGTLTKTYTPVSGTWGTPSAYVSDGNSNSTKQFIPTGSGTSVAIASWVGDLFSSSDAAFVRAAQTAGGTLGLRASQFIYNAAGNEVSAQWEFNTDSPKIQFAASGYDTAAVASTGGGLRVWVDDVEVQPGAFFQALATNNASTYTLITFTGAVKVRNIKILGIDGIRDVRILPNYTLYKVKTNPLKALWIGDSIGAGSAMGPSRTKMNWPNTVLNEIGMRYGITNASTGGTGVENAGTGVNFLTRVTATSNSAFLPPNSTTFAEAVNKFDVVFIAASGNDGSSSTTLQSNYVLLLQAIRTLQPNALIVVHGAWPGASAYAVSADYGNTKASAAFTAWADNKSLFIKTRSDASEGEWLTALGYSASGQTTATGNSSLYVGSDGTHPNDAGILFYARQTVKQLLNVLSI